jgi:hypothetical protein
MSTSDTIDGVNKIINLYGAQADTAAFVGNSLQTVNQNDINDIVTALTGIGKVAIHYVELFAKQTGMVSLANSTEYAVDISLAA